MSVRSKVATLLAEPGVTKVKWNRRHLVVVVPGQGVLEVKGLDAYQAVEVAKTKLAEAREKV